MKPLVLLFLASISPLFSLTAQTTDPELAEKLKAVMLLFDKNQQALKAEIAELNTSNATLTAANIKLYKELQTSQERIELLESENLLLRSRISEVAINELEAASLTTRSAPRISRSSAATVPSSSNRSVRQQNAQSSELININTASLEELMTLPLIDEDMAAQIISNRPYNSVEDLIINMGFGPMKLRRVSPYTTVE